VTLRDGRSLVATCEAALGSPARPLTEDQVLTKIRDLSKRDARGLAPEIMTLRAAVGAGSVPDVSCRDWIRKLFA
jgi:hypothetical protein